MPQRTPALDHNQTEEVSFLKLGRSLSATAGAAWYRVTMACDNRQQILPVQRLLRVTLRVHYNFVLDITCSPIVRLVWCSVCELSAVVYLHV